MISPPSQDSVTPRIQLRSPTIDFVERRLPEYHEAFNHPNARYDTNYNRFVGILASTHMDQSPRPQVPPVEAMKFWTGILPSAMSQLSEIPEPKGRSDSVYSIRDLSDWKGVNEKLKLARKRYEYENKVEGASPGFRNTIRQGARKVLDRSTAPLGQAAQFVPDIDIASPIVGAVKVLLAAYRKAAEVREEISTGFDDMSDGFDAIDFYVTMFPSDRNVIETAKKVVLAILKAVEQAIGFYISHQISRATSAVFKGPEYQKELRERLSEVKSYIDELEKQGERSYKYQNDLAHQQNRVEHAALYHQNQEEHRRTQGFIQLEAVNQFHMLIQISAQLQDMKQQYEALRADVILNRSRSCSPRSMTPQVQSPEELWEALQVPEIDNIDIEHITKQTGGLPFEDKGRAEKVVDTRQFKQWMLSDKHWIYSGNQWVRLGRDEHILGRTMKLLVHGDYDLNEKVSSLSILCVSLIGILRNQRNIVSLVFFCGRHLDGDENPGPLAMIRSLVGQLLQQNPYCPSGLAQYVSMQDARRGNIQELCKLFGCLIRQLPSTVTVFCILDGIGLYEREQYKDDMEDILDYILDLVEDEEHDIDTVFKLFLTNPRPTRYIRAAFQDEISLLNMASVSDNGQWPSSIRFSRQID
ncbi:hypothetical protein K445DRAFT_12109 [Daldinia sp. EC12]|nr:hypothetical protein K445DRAFT_12109 [Daldinia sp. EC12]